MGMVASASRLVFVTVPLAAALAGGAPRPRAGDPNIASSASRPIRGLFGSMGVVLCIVLVAANTCRAELETQRDVPGWPGRPYELFLPSSYGAKALVPLIVALHGGGGNSRAQRRLACPGGDIRNPGCMNVIADRAGFAVAYPNGTGARVFRNLRTWNAGGGKNGFQCVSGKACRDGIDDVAYFVAMLDDIGAAFQVDTSAVYFTGMSNGAAMAHRLACELPERVAGIAAVGGANQYAATAPCTASKAVLQIHGDADPCWSYAGGEQSCLDGNPGTKASVAESVADWARRNQCSGSPRIEQIPDTKPDGTVTAIHRYPGCQRPVVLYLVQNGGHAWPGGYQYFGERRIGRMSRDFSASEEIVKFFSALGIKP